MRIKFGYTLAETLITLLIIGIIAAVTLPSLQKTTGNKFEAMRIKCAYILEQTIDQMLDDDTLYPQSNSEASIGLAKTTAVKVAGVTYQGNTKFCEIFASRITKGPHSTVDCSNSNKKTFTSADGVDWYLPISNFNDKVLIHFDVNGQDEDPNCALHGNEDSCPKPDLFSYYLTPLGKLYPATNCGFSYRANGQINVSCTGNDAY